MAPSRSRTASSTSSSAAPGPSPAPSRSSASLHTTSIEGGGVTSLEDYVISRRGAHYVLYEGLLAEAHRQGLRGIVTRLIQAPAAENGGLAVCAAVVETSRGRF